MVGLVPVFIVAGFLESFVTRYTNMPMWLSISIIGTSLAFIIWYFVIYPIRLNKKSKKNNNNSLLPSIAEIATTGAEGTTIS